MDRIDMALWHKDHWTTYAYLASRILDYNGVPNLDNMRCDPNIHPGLHTLSPMGNARDGSEYPTRLKDGTLVHGHDDWSCVEDFVSYGLVEWNGTGIHPQFAFTDAGWEIWHQFNRWIAEHPGKWSATFRPRELDVAA